jgi:hypothetical protein
LTRTFLSRLARSTCCQRPFHHPPERDGSVAHGAHECAPVRPRNLAKIPRRCRTCQPAVPTGFPPDLHKQGGLWRPITTNQRPRTGASAPHSAARAAKRALRHTMTAPIFGAGRGGRDKNLRKDRLEVCFETLRGTLSPNASPVAGAIQDPQILVVTLDAGQRREFQKVRPATLLSTNSVIPPRPRFVQARG